MSEEKINNVCNHKCHELGHQKCTGCRSFHKSKQPVATHENDKGNPNINER